MPATATKRQEAVRREKLRRRARKDINSFIEYLALRDENNRPLHQADCHRELQSFLDKNKRALVGFPRGHGKTVQMVLRVCFELGRNPSIRVGIICREVETASRRVQFVRTMLSGPVGAKIRQVFPGLRIDQKQKERFDGFTVVRKANLIDPSVKAFGADGSGTGSRVDLLIGDDMVDPVNSATQEQRDKIYRRFMGDMMMWLADPIEARVWLLHTPWHEDDAHARIRTMSQKENSPWRVLYRPVGTNFEPVWPERWPAKALREKEAEVGQREFDFAFRLQVVSDTDTIFHTILFYDAQEFAERQGEPDSAQPLMHYISVDPAFTDSEKNDPTAMVAASVGTGKHIYVHDAVEEFIDSERLVDRIVEYANENGANYIIVENAGQQSLLLANLREACSIPIIEARPKGAGKLWADTPTRARQVAPMVRRGTVRLAGQRVAGGMEPTPGVRKLYDQLKRIPHTKHDDLTAAFTQLVTKLNEPWARAIKPREVEEEPVSAKGRLLAQMRSDRERADDPREQAAALWGWN